MDRSQRAGVSLVEVLVVIAILGILMAIILPAVQNVRETSRKSSCQNRMRQLGLAFANVESAHRAFPTNRDVYKQILPHLGHQANYDFLINNSRVSSPEVVQEFSCPSDTMPIIAEFGQLASYRLNEGTKFGEQSGQHKHYNGFQKFNSYNLLDQSFVSLNTPASAITDGLSQTAALSERLRYREGTRYLIAEPTPTTLARETGRYAWFISEPQPSPGAELPMREQCQHHRTVPSDWDGGHAPLTGADRGYNHLLGPNHPACINAVSSNRWGYSSEETILPPSSSHRGGVNVLFADGSLHFIQNQVDLDVWMALGTRSNNEPFQHQF
ncbi:DUF1559 domain-containing protein [Thalassoglobus sp. JC818]|uniref:DUF1559 family PulG-like putative transporter n=1 Tax=Thalassoglobus sp. JC818 TaxID=3232136 RepID=UPI0034588CA1